MLWMVEFANFTGFSYCSLHIPGLCIQNAWEYEFNRSSTLDKHCCVVIVKYSIYSWFSCGLHWFGRIGSLWVHFAIEFSICVNFFLKKSKNWNNFVLLQTWIWCCFVVELFKVSGSWTNNLLFATAYSIQTMHYYCERTTIFLILYGAHTFLIFFLILNILSIVMNS